MVPVGTAVRWAAAAALAIGGLIHLQLYFDGYRHFPNQNLGRSFIANGVASMVVACVLAARRDVVVRLAGAAVLVATLVAFAVSRTDRGIFGFAERGLQPSPQAVMTLIVEIAGLVLIAATFVPRIGPGADLRPELAASIGAIGLLGTIAGAALWARTSGEPSAAPTTLVTTSSADVTSLPPPAAASSTNAGATSSTPSPPRPTTAGAAATTAVPVTTTAAAPAASPPSADVVTINIADFAFDPATIEIPIGTTVEWVNNDSFAHTVVADDGSFESETMDQGDTFTFEFTEAGTFPYVCGIHPQMVANIVVTA